MNSFSSKPSSSSLAVTPRALPCRLMYMVFAMGGKWPYRSGFVSSYFQQAASLCSSHLAYSSGVSLKSRWCNHTIVLTWPQLRKNSLYILSERSDFRMVINLSMRFLLERYWYWDREIKSFHFSKMKVVPAFKSSTRHVVFLLLESEHRYLIMSTVD